MSDEVYEGLSRRTGGTLSLAVLGGAGTGKSTFVHSLERAFGSEEGSGQAQGNPQEFERLSGSRGAEYDGMRVHSVRLPGYVATQEVVFGEAGQVLTLRHDALSREAYVPGVALAVSKILTIPAGTLMQGLETLL